MQEVQLHEIIIRVQCILGDLTVFCCDYDHAMAAELV